MVVPSVYDNFQNVYKEIIIRIIIHETLNNMSDVIKL